MSRSTRAGIATWSTRWPARRPCRLVDQVARPETVLLQRDILTPKSRAQAATLNRIGRDWAWREDVRTANDRAKTGRVLSAPLWARGVSRWSTVSFTIPVGLRGEARAAAIRTAYTRQTGSRLATSAPLTTARPRA